MIEVYNFIFEGSQGRKSQADFRYSKGEGKSPLVIFCHGYKGFKDWGAWNYIAEKFVENGFSFLKFNFSHNGGTEENGIDFPDLAAFSQNTYSKELKDLHCLIDQFKKTNSEVIDSTDFDDIYLIGHSRGGSIALLFANSDKRIKKLATWAAVSDFSLRFPKDEELEVWRNSGLRYVRNARTRQNLPHEFQFYEDYEQHKDQLNIQMAATYLDIPYLIIHGDNDQVVPPEEAQSLNRWANQSELELIEETGHTFNTRQPWDESELPRPMSEAVEKTISFFKKP